ncbi:MAG TPA: carotenoid oxygenase family protein [Vicinamibacterales bacterium]|nr:carotenoid oxygenase family protein [Vicinamibacterales bacterium]
MDDHAPLIERAFSLEPRDTDSAAVDVDGVLPAFLRGTCLLNGPGRFARGDLRYRHWLDGDGLVSAVRFSADGVRVTNRFVRSTKFAAEEDAGRPIYRTFGTRFAGDALYRGVGLASPVNVSVYPYRGRLLAFGEQGLPWELDPDTLETKGLFIFDGQLNEIAPFGAHPKIDRQTGELFNFGVSFARDRPSLNVYRFGGNGRLVYRRRIALPYAASMHDFAMSEHHLVFYVSPLLLDVGMMLQDGATVMEALSWQPERGSQLLIVSRATGHQIAAIPVGHRHCLHLVNAFEQGGRLLADAVEFERPLYPEYQVLPSLFTDTFRGHPVRFLIDPATGALLDRQDVAYDRLPDFPAHDVSATGRAYGEFWMLGIGAAGKPGRKFFDQLVRIDWADGGADVYQAPPRHYLGGEPAFVPEPGVPRSGAVVCQFFDAEHTRSSIVVFDAFRIARGPVATIRLPAPMPLLFHSTFAAARG